MIEKKVNSGAVTKTMPEKTCCNKKTVWAVSSIAILLIIAGLIYGYVASKQKVVVSVPEDRGVTVDQVNQALDDMRRINGKTLTESEVKSALSSMDKSVGTSSRPTRAEVETILKSLK